MVPLKAVIQHVVQTFQMIIIDSYDKERLIDRVDILSTDTIFDENTLYLPSETDTHIPVPAEPERFLLLTDCPQMFPFSTIHMHSPQDSRQLYVSIRDFLKTESLIETHSNQLYHALYYGRGLKDVVTKAESFIPHPISVCDASYTIIQASPRMEKFSYGLERKDSQIFLNASEIESLKRLQIENKIYENKKAFLTRTADHPDTNWIFCAIRIQNVMAGYVAVCLEADIEATPYELRLTTALADVCAIEMQKHEFFTTRSGLKYENFLIDLLGGRFHDVNMISSRLELLDRKFCHFFCLIVLSCTEPHDSTLFNQSQMSALRRVYPNSMSVVYQDAIVLFLNQDTPILLNEEFVSPIEEFARRNHMKAGISQPFADILKIKYFYSQALNALTLGDSAHSSNILYFASDLLPQFLFTSTDYIGLEVGIHYHLKQLMDHDKEHHTEFIPTLRAFLGNDRNAAKTADFLHIHRSTFFYRLKKMEELLDVSLADSKLLFLYELSFMIWDYLSK